MGRLANNSTARTEQVHATIYAGGDPARKQLGIKGAGGACAHQVEHKLKTYPCSKGCKLYPVLH